MTTKERVELKSRKNESEEDYLYRLYNIYQDTSFLNSLGERLKAQSDIFKALVDYGRATRPPVAGEVGLNVAMDSPPAPA